MQSALLRFEEFLLILKLVAANLSNRKVRTVLSILLIAVPVALMLTLVGLSRGFIEDSQARARGVGADIIVRSPETHAGAALAISNMPEKLITRLGEVPHVRFAIVEWPRFCPGDIDAERHQRIAGRP